MAESFVLYSIKVSLVISITYLFFYLFLRNLSFYRWNRWFLLSGLLISFILPIIRIEQFYKIYILENINNLIPEQMFYESIESQAGGGSASFWSVITILMITGSVLLLMAFLFKLISLMHIIRKAVPFAKRTNIWLINGPVSPFSFLNRIFLNKAVYSSRQLKFIFAHEKVHVKEFHSLDIFLSELFIVVCWFNPFAWLYQRAIKQNLEYIADASVLQQGHEPGQYQLCLLDLSHSYGWKWPVTSFSVNTLRKRLYFMNRLKSSSWYQGFRYVFILPVLAAIFLSFNISRPQPDTLKSRKSAKITGDLNIYIKKDHALLTGEDGIAEIRGIRSLDIEKYPGVLLLHEGKVFSIDKLKDHLDNVRPYVLYVYLGTFAKQKYGEKGKVGIVTIMTEHNL